jgi:formate C-acetyltransferase
MFNRFVPPTSTHNLGRFRPVQYPYIKSDLETGKITDGEVLALLGELRHQVHEAVKHQASRAKRSQHAGFCQCETLTIGGFDADGKDASNELTYLVLEAANRVQDAAPHHYLEDS